MLPAIAQGAIGVQNKVDDNKIIKLLEPLNHKQTQMIINSERAFLKSFNGDCSTPIASYCYVCGDRLILKSGYFNETGDLQFYTIEEGAKNNGDELGKRSANKIKRMVYY